MVFVAEKYAGLAIYRTLLWYGKECDEHVCKRQWWSVSENRTRHRVMTEQCALYWMGCTHVVKEDYDDDEQDKKKQIRELENIERKKKKRRQNSYTHYTLVKIKTNLRLQNTTYPIRNCVLRTGIRNKYEKRAKKKQHGSDYKRIIICKT